MQNALTQSLAAAPVRPEFVACFAPALESPLTVGAALAAVPLLGTFVHICDMEQGQKISVLPSSSLSSQADQLFPAHTPAYFPGPAGSLQSKWLRALSWAGVPALLFISTVTFIK